MRSIYYIDVDCIVLHILHMSPEIEQCDDIILDPVDIMTSLESSEELRTKLYSYVYENKDVFEVNKLRYRNPVVV